MKSKKNKKILIFGGNGFLGKTIIDLLLKLEFEVVVFTRKKFLEKNLSKHVSKKNIKFVLWDPNNIKFIEDEFLGAETTINLCGILYENKRNDFYKVHSDLPSTLAELCVKFNVKNFLHVSALGVSETSKSRYSSSKASGERRLLEIFPKAKIVRPSLIFGDGDNFFGQFSQMASISPVLPLISRSTKFQPVSVEDVAAGIINLINSKGKINSIYEFGGKSIYTFEDLLKMLLDVKKIRRILLPLNSKLMKIPALFLQQLPKPPFTVDQMILLENDNILMNNLPGLGELGIVPKELQEELIKIYQNK